MLNVSEVRSCFAANNVIRGGSEPRRDRLDQRDRPRESSSPIRRAGASVAQCESLALSRLVGCMRHTTCSPAVGHERTWSHARESGASTGAPWPARPFPSEPRPSQLWPEKFGPESRRVRVTPGPGHVRPGSRQARVTSGPSHVRPESTLASDVFRVVRANTRRCDRRPCRSTA
jgi:hypothetical protein